MTITLNPDIENAITEQAQREGTTAEQIALGGLRHLFITLKPTLEDVLALAAQVHKKLLDKER